MEEKRKEKVVFLKNLVCFKIWFFKNWKVLFEVIYVIFLCWLFYQWGYESALTNVINDVGGLSDFCLSNLVWGV